MKAKRFYYLIGRKVIHLSQTEAVLDMLRFDHAVVESNPPESYYLFSSEHKPDTQRWKSFQIQVFGVFRDAAEAVEYGRRFAP